MRDEIEKYINEHYHALEENPWEKYPNFTTYKHVGNKKWFALVMDVPYEVLNINKKGMVGVLNVKNIPEMIGSLRKEEGILPAYHMNKEHWISILLDGTVPIEKIYDLIDVSYDLTGKKWKRNHCSCEVAVIFLWEKTVAKRTHVWYIEKNIKKYKKIIKKIFEKFLKRSVQTTN